MKKNREQFSLVQQLMRLDEKLGLLKDKGEYSGFSDSEIALVVASGEHSLIAGENLRTLPVDGEFVPADYSKIRDLMVSLRNSGVSNQRLAGLRTRGENLAYMVRGESK